MTGRLSCAEAFRRLDDYLDRELSAGELEDVERHLESCAECAAEFGVEREVLDEIRAKLCRIAVPQGLRERIAAALRAAR